MLKTRLTLLTVAIGVISNSAFASSNVYSPNVEQGELEIEWKGNRDFDKKGDDKNGGQKHKYAIGYGFTNYWASEIYLGAEKTADQGYKTRELEWENRFQLTEQGKNFADLGLYLSFTKALDSKIDHDAIEAKILLEKQIGQFINRANLGIEKELRQVDGQKPSKGGEIELLWMTKYSWRKSFEPGFEYHGNFGNYLNYSKYSKQEHQFGPAIYGKISNFKYDLGLLIGVSNAAPNQQIKWNLEYEF